MHPRAAKLLRRRILCRTGTAKTSNASRPGIPRCGSNRSKKVSPEGALSSRSPAARSARRCMRPTLGRGAGGGGRLSRSRIALLPLHHRDPFDRLLVAQARCGSLASDARRDPLRYPWAFEASGLGAPRKVRSDSPRRRRGRRGDPLPAPGDRTGRCRAREYRLRAGGRGAAAWFAG